MGNNKNIYILALILIIPVVILITAISASKEAKEYLALKTSDLTNAIFAKNLPLDAIEIITSKDKYQIGEEIFFGAQNKTDKTFEVENECPREPMDVYRQDGIVWTHISGASDIRCKVGKKHIIIHPYELVGASYLPWEHIIFNQPGHYKIRLELVGYRTRFEKEFDIVKR